VESIWLRKALTKTLIILNPHAGGGQAGRHWQQIEPLLWHYLGELVVAITERPDEVALHLDKAYASGLTRVISIGGDGTNHALVNALAALNEQNPDGPPMIYGILPIGTGRDWARSMGIPFDPLAAARWIADAQPRLTDIGLLVHGEQRHHFLNIASVGLGGEVDRRVSATRHRRPWTFFGATVRSILNYRPQPMQVRLDGRDWYEGDAYLVAVANGTTFGHGMRIAPQARVDDGLFDVVLVTGMSAIKLLTRMRKVYEASHLDDPGVRFARAQSVTLSSPDGVLSLDLDGEFAQADDITFRVRPGFLPILS
jgi:YegS/Rv2252/BmrU family lipid kinase